MSQANCPKCYKSDATVCTDHGLAAKSSDFGLDNTPDAYVDMYSYFCCRCLFEGQTATTKRAAKKNFEKGNELKYD